MRNNNAKFNYIFAISMIILSAIISYVSSKYLDGIAVKFLAISIIAFLTAFIVNKFQITIYLIFASVALVYFDGYGQGEILNYLPYILELFAGCFLISILKNIFYNHDFFITIFAVIFGRLVFYVVSFVLFDVIFKQNIFSEFLLKTINEQIYGVIANIIVVPLICYGIRKNTIIFN